MQSQADTPARDGVVRALRGMVVRGEVNPGSRLPDRQNLIRQLGTSGMTLQRAVDQLVDEGFLWAKRRAGTFVADNPPHLSTFAIVLPSHRGNAPSWSLFHEAVALAAEGAAEGMAEGMGLPSGKRIMLLDGVDHVPNPEHRATIERGMRDHLFAGIAFIGSPAEFVNSTLPYRCSLPMVSVAEQPVGPGKPSIYFNFDAFWQAVADRLTSVHRHRASVLLLAPGPDAMDLTRRLNTMGLRVEPEWVQYSEPIMPQSTRQIIKLLFRDPARRPTSLVIADDNLVAPAINELQALGLRIPEDVHVIAHANYPALPSDHPGVDWIGFDAHQLVHTALTALDRLIDGRKVNPLTRLEPKARFSSCHSTVLVSPFFA